MEDVVIPNGNEKDFIIIAKELGIKKLVFLYSIDNFKSIELPKSNLEIIKGIFAKPRDVSRAKSYTKYVYVDASEDVRSIIEQNKDFFVYNIENDYGRDSPHYRKSSINQVICKLLHEKDVKVCISFSKLINSKNKIKLLGRMMQNIRFYKKYNVKYDIKSFAKQPYEMRSLIDLVSLKRLF